MGKDIKEYKFTIEVRVLATRAVEARSKLDKQVPVSHKVLSCAEVKEDDHD